MPPLNLALSLNIPKLPIYLKQVDEELKRSLTAGDQELLAAADRLVGAGGKRLRPALVIAAATSQGGKANKSVIRGCAAIELLHLASLVHDDIIDNAPTRWNQPTINSQDGAARAIVVGDYLLAQAGVAAAAISSEAAGLVFSAMAALCDGQSRELTDQYDSGRTLDSLLNAISGKTAALMAAACQLGALCAGSDERQVTALGRYGQKFGMAFQLADDALDFLADPILTGKTIGGDAKQGVYTLPLLLGLRSTASKDIEDWLKRPKKSAARLTDILLKSQSIQKTISQARNYNRAAAQSLKGLSRTPVALGLANLPEAYLAWALNNLTAKEYRPAIAKSLA